LDTNLLSALYMSKTFNETPGFLSGSTSSKKPRIIDSEVIIVEEEEVVVVEAVKSSTTEVAGAGSSVITESTERHGTMMAFLRMSAEKRKPTTATIVASEQGSRDKCLVLSVPATALENIAVPTNKWLSVCPEISATDAPLKERFQHGTCEGIYAPFNAVQA
jgi:hypothetical protein